MMTRKKVEGNSLTFTNEETRLQEAHYQAG